MKWLVITCFLLWARHGEGGALKCGPESEDASCTVLQEKQEVEQQEFVPGTGVQSSEVLEAECLPGSEWESNCHSCRCSAEGSAECLKQTSCDTPNTDPIRCKPNTTFERDCNKCTCLGNGLGLCTLKNCRKTPAQVPSKADIVPVPSKADIVPVPSKADIVPVPSKADIAQVPSKADLPAGSDCAPGSEWKSGCNDCVCSSEGLRLCSALGCPEGQESEPLLRCAPHSLWKKECNTCWCTSDGRAMCTRIGCVGIPSDMHFSDEQNSSESLEIVEADKLSKSPEAIENTLLEPNVIDRNKNIATELVEDNLTGVILKDLDGIDDNELETPKEVSIGFSDEVEQVVKHDMTESIHKNVQELDINIDNIDIQEEKYNALKNTKESKERSAETVESEVIIREFETSYINHLNQNLRADTNSKGVNTELKELGMPYLVRNIQDSIHRVIKRSVCKPNQDFQSDCNTCKCSATGQSYACTQNECMDKDKEDLDKEVEVFMESEGVDHIERHSVCKPSATFFVGCNPCHCNADGTDFSCTNKACPLPEDVEVFHELNAVKSAPKHNITKKKVCVENRMFIMNCNTCWCNEDGTSYMCTRRVCVPDFEDDPNIEEAKPEKETQSRKVRAAPQEPPKTCQPGQEFRMDCNKCLCDNEGQDFSCTRIDCNALNNNNNNGGTRRKRDVSHKVPADCVPGSVFDQDCNVCRCTEDGGHATCTLKRCSNKEDNKVSTTESSFRCNPGEQFKQSCNDCSCSADGRSVFCTLFICDEDLTP